MNRKYFSSLVIIILVIIGCLGWYFSVELQHSRLEKRLLLETPNTFNNPFIIQDQPETETFEISPTSDDVYEQAFEKRDLTICNNFVETEAQINCKELTNQRIARVDGDSSKCTHSSEQIKQDCLKDIALERGIAELSMTPCNSLSEGSKSLCTEAVQRQGFFIQNSNEICSKYSTERERGICENDFELFVRQISQRQVDILEELNLVSSIINKGSYMECENLKIEEHKPYCRIKILELAHKNQGVPIEELCALLPETKVDVLMIPKTLYTDYISERDACEQIMTME